jgi:hypothetical protein
MGIKKEFIFTRALWIGVMIAAAVFGLREKSAWPF